MRDSRIQCSTDEEVAAEIEQSPDLPARPSTYWYSPDKDTESCGIFALGTGAGYRSL